MANLLAMGEGAARTAPTTRTMRRQVTSGFAFRVLTRRMKASLQSAYAIPDPTLGQVWPRGNPTVDPTTVS